MTDGYLSELMGTLARDAQRNKTVLNMYQRAKDQATKLPPRPQNPRNCRDVDHAKQYRHQVIREISHLMTAITQEDLDLPPALQYEQEQRQLASGGAPPPASSSSSGMPGAAVDGGDEEAPLGLVGDDVASDDADGFTEEQIAAGRQEFAESCARVRKLNTDINSLRKELKRWDERVVALGGEGVQQTENREHTFNGVMYFGAARRLPEYVKAVEERNRAARERGEMRAKAGGLKRHHAEAAEGEEPGADDGLDEATKRRIGAYVAESSDDEDEGRKEGAAKQTANDGDEPSVADSAYLELIAGNQRSAADQASPKAAAARRARQPQHQQPAVFANEASLIEAQLLGDAPVFLRLQRSDPTQPAVDRGAVVYLPNPPPQSTPAAAAAPNAAASTTLLPNSEQYLWNPPVVTPEELEARRAQQKREALLARVRAAKQDLSAGKPSDTS